LIGKCIHLYSRKPYSQMHVPVRRLGFEAGRTGPDPIRPSAPKPNIHSILRSKPISKLSPSPQSAVYNPSFTYL
jgi:hypothetical protein